MSYDLFVAVEKEQTLKSWWASLPAPSQLGNILLLITAFLILAVTITSGIIPETNVIYLIILSVISVLAQIGASFAFSETQKQEETAKRELLERRQVNEKHAKSVDRNLRSTLKSAAQSLTLAEETVADREGKDSRDFLHVIGNLSVGLSHVNDQLVNVIEDWHEYFPADPDSDPSKKKEENGRN